MISAVHAKKWLCLWQLSSFSTSVAEVLPPRGERGGGLCTKQQTSTKCALVPCSAICTFLTHLRCSFENGEGSVCLLQQGMTGWRKSGRGCSSPFKRHNDERKRSYGISKRSDRISIFAALRGSPVAVNVMQTPVQGHTTTDAQALVEKARKVVGGSFTNKCGSMLGKSTEGCGVTVKPGYGGPDQLVTTGVTVDVAVDKTCHLPLVPLREKVLVVTLLAWMYCSSSSTAGWMQQAGADEDHEMRLS